MAKPNISTAVVSARGLTDTTVFTGRSDPRQKHSYSDLGLRRKRLPAFRHYECDDIGRDDRHQEGMVFQRQINHPGCFLSASEYHLGPDDHGQSNQKKSLSSGSSAPQPYRLQSSATSGREPHLRTLLTIILMSFCALSDHRSG